MDNKLFQNDNIVGNSLIGLEIKGMFKDDENVLLDKLKNILNRNITFINSDYKLAEPTDLYAVVLKEGSSYIIKTPMYSYFEAIFLLPNILEFLKNLKSYKNSYMYINIGFNEDATNLSNLNILKFIFEFNENMILKLLGDVTKDNNIKKLTDIKPTTLENCSQTVQKQVDEYKYLSPDEDNFGISFTQLNSGKIIFKYTQDIDYRNKWEDILKCMNHTIITLYNTSKNTDFDEKEIEKIDKLNTQFKDYETAFSCYEMFSSKFKSIKLTVDLNNDKSVINMMYPAIKDNLFNVTVYNDIKNAYINYDSDFSKLQIKDIDLKSCYGLSHIDIVNCDIEDSCIKDCDIYDSNIKNSTIVRCNLFGYANCNESNFKNCYISRNIKLKDCHVYGHLGKMGGIMIGGTLKDTTIMTSMSDIHDNVEKENVNEIE